MEKCVNTNAVCETLKQNVLLLSHSPLIAVEILNLAKLTCKTSPKSIWCQSGNCYCNRDKLSTDTLPQVELMFAETRIGSLVQVFIRTRLMLCFFCS
jgi:hypothetical protein